MADVFEFPIIESKNVHLAVEFSSGLIEWKPGEATTVLDGADLQVLRVEIPERYQPAGRSEATTKTR